MIGGTERLLEARRAVPTDRQKSIGVADERDPTAREGQS